ncbi:MAG TPA: lipid II flippase MurJ, partial [Pyrinomonadaceae bacterium]
MPPQPDDEPTSLAEVKPESDARGGRDAADAQTPVSSDKPRRTHTADRTLQEAANLRVVDERQDAGVIAGETLPTIGATTGEFPGEQVDAARERETENATGKYAFLVGAGILLSRIVGLIRQRVFAYYFGNSAAKDAFDAAFKIPNFLQNVFGEGALSASFIPVYANLLARKDEREAGRVAGAIFALLALITSLLVLLGVLTTPYLISLIAYGFEGERRELTIRLVKIFFPGAGLLVLSAWCLGVLNSHRRFFLSYTAPVIWNL